MCQPRIEQHIERKSLFTSQVQTMIFDEADTILDAGYDEPMSYFMRIVTNPEVIEQRGFGARAVFVSATLGGTLKEFLRTVFGKDNSSQFERILDSSTHLNLANIRHNFIHLTEYDKHKTFQNVIGDLAHTLKKHGTKAIVFCDTVKSAQSTDHLLNQLGHQTVSLHGDVPARLRVQNYDRFQKGEVSFLVATDVGGRGLDFKKVSHVINFDFPQNASDYLHRVGRTGRAGQSGTAISLYRNSDQSLVNKLKESYEHGIPLLVNTSSYGKINKEILEQKNSKKESKSLAAHAKIEQHRGVLLKSRAIEARESSTQSEGKGRRINNFKKAPHDRLYRTERSLKAELKSVPKDQRHQQQTYIRSISKRLRSVAKQRVVDSKLKK